MNENLSILLEAGQTFFDNVKFLNPDLNLDLVNILSVMQPWEIFSIVKVKVSFLKTDMSNENIRVAFESENVYLHVRNDTEKVVIFYLKYYNI